MLLPLFPPSVLTSKRHTFTLSPCQAAGLHQVCARNLCPVPPCAQICKFETKKKIWNLTPLSDVRWPSFGAHYKGYLNVYFQLACRSRSPRLRKFSLCTRLSWAFHPAAKLGCVFWVQQGLASGLETKNNIPHYWTGYGKSVSSSFHYWYSCSFSNG